MSESRGLEVVSQKSRSEEKKSWMSDHLGVLVVRYCWAVFIPNVQAHISPFCSVHKSG